MGRQRNGNRTVNSEWDGVFFMGLARYFYLFWAAWDFSNQSELTDVMYMYISSAQLEKLWLIFGPHVGASGRTTLCFPHQRRYHRPHFVQNNSE